jgi:hypothetical protein
MIEKIANEFNLIPVIESGSGGAEEIIKESGFH